MSYFAEQIAAGSRLFPDAIRMRNLLSPILYFSYSHFMVHDWSERLPGCAWTMRHFAQGFARRESTVNFSTLFEFGYAQVTVNQGSYEPREDNARVIAVPFRVISGTVIVDGPEELKPERNFVLPVGNYLLVAAQRATDEDEEAIDLFFEGLAKPSEQSSILVADYRLGPPPCLLETAGVAGEVLRPRN